MSVNSISLNNKIEFYRGILEFNHVKPINVLVFFLYNKLYTTVVFILQCLVYRISCKINYNPKCKHLVSVPAPFHYYVLIRIYAAKYAHHKSKIAHSLI